MDISRRQLYAAGLPFGECATQRLPGGAIRYGGGGDSESSTSTTGATTETTNIDQRMAIQDGVGINGSGNSTVYTVNSSDAVVAMADMGADIIKRSGGAVVELYKNAGQQNTDAWNTTLTQGVKLVDRLIDKVGDGFTLSEKVIDSFQPNENKNTDAIKTAAIAAGVIGVAMLWSKK